jgi:hypothetical protein
MRKAKNNLAPQSPPAPPSRAVKGDRMPADIAAKLDQARRREPDAEVSAMFAKIHRNRESFSVRNVLKLFSDAFSKSLPKSKK